MRQKKELPDPVTVLAEVTTFVGLARDGAYMAGDRRVHHTERSRWRHTFRRLVADALAALAGHHPSPRLPRPSRFHGTYTSVMDYLDYCDGEPIPGRESAGPGNWTR